MPNPVLEILNLNDLILESAWCEEHVDDLVLLDGQRMEVDVLDGLNLAVFHETSELGAWDPLLLLSLALALALLALAFALALITLALVAEATSFAEAALTTHDCKN